jgi:CO/xanthine dehydrogenase FAD-binding subunit
VIAGNAFVRPKSLDETCALLAKRVAAGERTMVLAGGTDLVVEQHLGAITVQPPAPQLVVDVSRLTELAKIDDRGDVIRLGGGVTYRTLRVDAHLAQRLPLLAQMSKDVGALQIQARGTLAGNLATASPAADGVAALAALDAVIGLKSVRGERSVPIADFYQGYKKTARAADELITWIDVRVPTANARFLWRKVGTRLAQAISKVALAAVAEIENGIVTHARFGMASVGPTTALLPHVRAAMEGQPVASLIANLDAFDRALASDIKPIDDIRSTGEYRMHVAKALVRGFVRQL